MLEKQDQPVDHKSLENGSNPSPPPQSAPNVPIDFPEGGLRGWATVAGAFLLQFCGFGYTSSFGVYQDYYVRIHISNETPSTISWIGSVNAFLVVALGILAGRLYDRGYFYHLLWGGSLLASFSLFMLSLTQENHFYQVFLTQALGAGIGAGLVYVPSVAVVSHYFKKRRSAVMTLVATGSSVGAIVHPIMLNNTLNKLGFANAARANAGLITGFYLIACLLMRTRLPPPKNTPDLWMSCKKFIRDIPYITCSIGFLFFTMGMYFPLFYLQLDAIKHGNSQTFAFYSLVILNFCSFVGRFSSGFLVGPLGVWKLTVIATGAAAALIFGMVGLSGVASVVVIAVLYGFFVGIYVALLAPMMANLADDISEIGVRMGIGFIFAGIGGLIGTPIEGALLTDSFIWWRPGVFSGVMATAGFVLFVITELALRSRRK